jgi:hypothetical protein
MEPVILVACTNTPHTLVSEVLCSDHTEFFSSGYNNKYMISYLRSGWIFQITRFKSTAHGYSGI